MTFDLRETYDRFFHLGGPPPNDRNRPWQYRRKETSLRWAGCQVLVELVRERRPRNVLDLGSGLTTHILRGLQGVLPDMQVVTVDTDERWLMTTMRELKRDGLTLDGCMAYDDFLAYESALPGEFQFDLISVDHGNITFRAGEVDHLNEWLAPTGVLFIDDWHMPPLEEIMRPRLLQLGFRITVPPESLDEGGGFVAIAERSNG